MEISACCQHVITKFFLCSEVELPGVMFIINWYGRTVNSGKMKYSFLWLKTSVKGINYLLL